mgnify:CR=1 FL=1
MNEQRYISREKMKDYVFAYIKESLELGGKSREEYPSFALGSLIYQLDDYVCLKEGVNPIHIDRIIRKEDVKYYRRLITDAFIHYRSETYWKYLMWSNKRGSSAIAKAQMYGKQLGIEGY